MAITRLSNNDLLTPGRSVSARGGAVPAGPQFNSATGGTTTDVSNYNGTGQTWRVHTFTSSGTFTVVDRVTTFRVLVVAGGGGGGGSGLYFKTGGAGGAGGAAVNDSISLSGANSVTVGAGGAGLPANTYDVPAPSGGTSSLSSVSASGGTGGYGGNSYTYGNGPAGVSGPSVTTTITGTSTLYANATYGGGGAGTDGTAGAAGGTGKNGVVIVAYRIA